jgi:hypothetical protein
LVSGSEGGPTDLNHDEGQVVVEENQVWRGTLAFRTAYKLGVAQGVTCRIHDTYDLMLLSGGVAVRVFKPIEAELTKTDVFYIQY